MEVNRINVPPEVVSKKKFKLPSMNKPGKILSLTTKFINGKRIIRGVDKSKAFKNTITIDVSVTGKNVNLKIYPQQIHMCGVKSREMAIEAGRIVIDKLEKAQEIIEYIQSHPDEANRTVEWIKQNTCGDEEYVEEHTSNIVNKDNIKPFTDEMIKYLKSEAQADLDNYIQYAKSEQESIDRNSFPNNTPNNLVVKIIEEGPIIDIIDDASGAVNIPEPELNPNYMGYVESEDDKGWSAVEKVNYLILPKEFVEQGYYPTHSKRPTNVYPEGVDGKIANFLLDQAFDFCRHDLYGAHLDWLLSLDKIIEDKVDISNICTSMCNYNYDLGFHIKRGEVSERINGVCGFVPIYENTFDHSVKIQLPYTIPEEHADKIKIKRKPKHTFILYKGGKITQSGSCEELAKDAYILFNRVIDSIRPFIEDKDDDMVTLKIPKLEDILAKNKRNGVDWVADGTMKVVSTSQSKILSNQNHQPKTLSQK